LAQISIYDPVEKAAELLITTRPGWGSCYYEQRSNQLGGRAATELTFRRGDEARAQVPTHVWIPWTALDGLKALTIEIHGCASGARLFLDCLDAEGWGMRFSLGSDQAEGWRSFQFDPGDISATWGPCAGKRQFISPLQPVALVIEDHENLGQWTLGLGRISADAELAEPSASGDPSCQLDRNTLTLDVRSGTRRMLRNFGLHGLLPGTAPADFRQLSLRNVSAIAPAHYSAQLVAGDLALPAEVQLVQVSASVWILRYSITMRPGLKLDSLDLRGSLNYRDVVGLSYGAGEQWLGKLDGQPARDPLLAEPAIWEPLVIGSSGRGRLRIKADGPVLKTLQLLDLRNEHGVPEYAVEIVISREEEFPVGGTLNFGVLIDTSS
jgi:hypothetical protein